MANTKQKLLEDIECEGFDYAVNHYDDYSDIPDPTLQKLLGEYYTARKALIEYLGVDA